MGITEIIKIEILEKVEEYKSKSHPNHILRLLEERMECWKEWGISPHELWMVVDRDKQDRSEKQLREIIDKCKKEGFNIALTNPAFEFWLLLHVDDLKRYNRLDIFENRKIDSKKRFLDIELSKKIGGYSKGNLDFKKLEPGIREAIQRAYKFENKLENLVNSLGTNIQILIGYFIN